MGLLIFIMASGLTLVFGLMDVMNFAHGVFIAVGAYVAASVMKAVRRPAGAESFAPTCGARARACSRHLVAALLGLFFERVIIRPVYGQHLKQILITTGGMIVAEQLIHVVWGPDLLPLPRPDGAARLVPDRRRRAREVTASPRWWSASRCSPRWC